MTGTRTILLLAPTAAEQARVAELGAALEAGGSEVEQMVVEGNYERLLDRLAGAVLPVVVK